MGSRWAVTAFGVALLAARVGAEPSASSSFITTVERDTISIEQYTRQGNVITGDWVSNQGSTQLHHYVLTLGADGMPARYDMTYSVPGLAAGPGTLRSVSITYGPDSATYVTLRDTAVTQRVAMKSAYPMLGKSVVGLELGLARLLAAHADSSTLVVNLPTGPVLTPVRLPVRLFGADSARVAGTALARFTPDGRLLGLSAGPAATRRVPALDVPSLVTHFVAANAAAAAAHPEIKLSAAALQVLVGEYSVTPSLSLTVTRDGEKLLIAATGQAQIQLFAESPTRFFARAVNAQVEFQTGPAGDATALVLVQAGTRTRATRKS